MMNWPRDLSVSRIQSLAPRSQSEIPFMSFMHSCLCNRLAFEQQERLCKVALDLYPQTRDGVRPIVNIVPPESKESLKL